MNTEPGWQSRPEVVGAQRRTLRVLTGAQMMGSLGVGAATSMGSIIAYQVTDNEAMAGISRTVALLGAAGFGVPLAMLAVRRGRRFALSLSMLGGVAGAALQILAVAHRSLWLLIAGLLVYAVAQAGGYQARFAATDLEQHERHTRSLALVVWMSTIGTVLGPNLAAPGEVLGAVLNVPPIAGAYVIAGGAFAGAWLILFTGLRPDPLLEAQRHEAAAVGGPGVQHGIRQVIGEVLARPTSRFAFVAVILNHMVMVTVMTMSAVHLHNHGHSLRIVGLTISLHTLGMFAFSPIVGRLADRYGRAKMIVTGQLINACALVLCFLAGPSVGLTMAGLFLLGLGWSFGMVSGSALLSDSVRPGLRTQAQGATDTSMSFFAAFGAGVAGPVQAAFGFSWLSVISMCCLVPVFVLARAGRRPSVG